MERCIILNATATEIKPRIIVPACANSVASLINEKAIVPKNIPAANAVKSPLVFVLYLIFIAATEPIINPDSAIMP
ncbi:hypothetical protein BH23THE1_BH23THE1_20900 [soil metagenome]